MSALGLRRTTVSHEVIPVMTKGEVPVNLINQWVSQANAGIASACEPLANFGINYLLYVKRFHDGSQIELTTHLTCSEFYYKNSYYLIGPFMNTRCHYNDGIFLWAVLPYQQLYGGLRKHFNIDNGVTIIKKQNDGNEFFHFAGSEKNTQLTNFYLNQQYVLDRFILYFKDKFADQIKAAEKTRILLPNESYQHDMNENPYHQAPCNTSLEELMPITRYYICEASETYLTQREIVCAKWYVAGKTAQEIAIILNIAKRTVEAHLVNVKQKLNCYKQSQLAFKLAKIVHLLQ